jgi:hypothetical protein
MGQKDQGKIHYFGPWDDPDSALQKYLDQKDDLHAGRTPRVKGDGLTVAGLCNRFLTGKKHLRDNGEIRPATFREYYLAAERVVDAFSRNRLVDDLAADDFSQLRVSLVGVFGPVALGNEINRVRILFKFGFDAGLINKPIRFGPGFKRPSKIVLRLSIHLHRRRHCIANNTADKFNLSRFLSRAIEPLGYQCNIVAFLTPKREQRATVTGLWTQESGAPDADVCP